MWFDVEMGQKSEAAMEEGVKNSSHLIAIVTGSYSADRATSRTSFDEHAQGNAYFSRSYCLQELRWATSSGINIQPVMAMADKSRVGEFIGQAPEDLKCLGKTDWIDLNQSMLGIPRNVVVVCCVSHLSFRLLLFPRCRRQGLLGGWCEQNHCSHSLIRETLLGRT